MCIPPRREPDAATRCGATPRGRPAALWNLFLPGEHGAGLTNLQYAPLAEITGRSPQLAPAALNCAAPDTGNMEVLAEFGTPEQQRAVARTRCSTGEIRSAFAMTEPRRRLVRRHQHRHPHRARRRRLRHQRPQVVHHPARMNPNCAIFIVMGKTDPGADRHRQQSMILVPRDTPGVTVGARHARLRLRRRATTAGTPRCVRPTSGCRPANLIGDEGDGFAIAQARLGPGRIHHCMRLIGMAERALELMCRRVDWSGSRSASRWPSRAWCRTGSPSPGSASSRPGCWCSRPPG